MKLSLTLALALVVTASQAQQSKTYDLKLDWKPLAGYKSQITDTTSMKMNLSIAGQTDAFVTAEATSFAALEEVISATADGGSELRWTFSEATQLKDGRTVPLGVQGKKVRVKHVKGQPREFSLEDGSAIGAEDLAALKKAFSNSDDKPGQPSGADIFAPKQPVRAGESWSPDLKALAIGLFDADMAQAVDMTRSKATFTLVSVETRGGAEFGKIEGVVELALNQMGPMRFDTPVTMKMTVHGDICIDTKQPDGVLRMEMEMKGATSASSPNGKVPIDLNMTMNGQKTVTTVK